MQSTSKLSPITSGLISWKSRCNYNLANNLWNCRDHFYSNAKSCLWWAKYFDADRFGVLAAGRLDQAVGQTDESDFDGFNLNQSDIGDKGGTEKPKLNDSLKVEMFCDWDETR